MPSSINKLDDSRALHQKWLLSQSRNGVRSCSKLLLVWNLDWTPSSQIATARQQVKTQMLRNRMRVSENDPAWTASQRSADVPRQASVTRVNSRLQERLAKAVVTRNNSKAHQESPYTSQDVTPRISLESGRERDGPSTTNQISDEASYHEASIEESSRAEQSGQVCIVLSRSGTEPATSSSNLPNLRHEDQEETLSNGLEEGGSNALIGSKASQVGNGIATKPDGPIALQGTWATGRDTSVHRENRCLASKATISHQGSRGYCEKRPSRCRSRITGGEDGKQG